MRPNYFIKKIVLVFLGMFLSFVILEMGLRIAGRIVLFSQEKRNTASLEEKNGEIRILCLGESTTVWGGDNAWPYQLERILNKKLKNIKVTVFNEGRHAIETPVILSKLEENLDKYNPDIVITMMGVNDGNYTVAFDDKEVLSKKNDKKTLADYSKAIKLIKSILLAIERKKNELFSFDQEDDNERQYYEEIVLEEKNMTVDERITKACHFLEDRNYKEAEKRLELILKNNPGYSEAYIYLAKCYIEQSKYEQTIELLNKGLNIDFSDEMYVLLGICYRMQADFNKAELMFKKALENNMKNFEAYSNLGYLYRDQKRYSESENILKKALSSGLTNNPEIYRELAVTYREMPGMYKEEEQALLESIRLRPQDEWSYIHIGWCYWSMGKWDRVEWAFKEAIKKNPYNAVSYLELGTFYLEQERFEDYDKLFKNADIFDNKKSLYEQGYLIDRLCGQLAVIFLEKGDFKSAKRYFKKAEEIRLKYHPPGTKQNYKKIKKILDKRQIKYVCVQYPMRSVEPLKKMLNYPKNVIFVDNEKIFKDAVKNEGFNYYFEDRFAGDFGHGTDKGNYLLAENIAKVLLEKIFINIQDGGS